MYKTQHLVLSRSGYSVGNLQLKSMQLPIKGSCFQLFLYCSLMGAKQGKSPVSAIFAWLTVDMKLSLYW